jgi:hypothetical protein
MLDVLMLFPKSVSPQELDDLFSRLILDKKQAPGLRSAQSQRGQLNGRPRAARLDLPCDSPRTQSRTTGLSRVACAPRDHRWRLVEVSRGTSGGVVRMRAWPCRYPTS